jgi:hypothetical protein
MSRYRTLIATLASSSLALSVLSPFTAVAAPRSAPGSAVRAERRVPLDAQGRELIGPTGSRLHYDDSQRPPPPRAAELKGPDAARGVDPADPAMEGFASTLAAGDLQVRQEWFRATFGTGIGATGLSVVDLDADGDTEIVASASPGGFAASSYWYIVSRQGAGYAQEWVSGAYAASLQNVRVAQADADAALEVLVGTGNQVHIYDGATRSLQQTLNLPTGTQRGLTVADVDADGSRELVFCDSTDLYVLDLATGAVEYRGVGQGGKDVAVGNVDADAALELVVANGTAAGLVVDGLSRAVQWSNPAGFGDLVRVGNLDADAPAEIVAGFTWTTGLRVYNGDTQTLAYNVPVSNLAAVRLADVEGDGATELLYGDAQWGSVHVLDGATGVQKFALANPEHGVTDIGVGNVDADAAKEILWGAGFTSTGEDHLYVADSATRVRDWESQDISGPFYALGYGDVDADGRTELLHGSFESDSGYSDGLFFFHDAATYALEYQSGPPTGSDITGLWRIQAANVDADAQAEVFVTSSVGYDGVIICYDGLTRAEQWRARQSAVSFRSMQLVDVDGDGALEVVASVGVETSGAAGAFVYVFDAASGALEWKSPALSGGWQQITLLRVANVDADAALEIVAGDRSQGLWIIDAGTRVVQLDTASLNLSALELVDLDNDGVAEIVIGNTGGQLLVVDEVSGAPIQSLFSAASGPIQGLAIRDMNLDGVKDYVFAHQDRLHVVNGSTGGYEWSSDLLGTQVGAHDSLLVADLDADGRLEMVINVGTVGFRVFEARAGEQLASYDAVLRAPRCATAGVSCDSGLLLTGRGNLGPELHAPNTINSSCGDDSAGSFHSDESNDQIRVVSVDGTRFAPGKTVRIEAQVWAWSSPSTDKLDLYYAANANAPVWTYLTTLTPSVPGAQTLSATYVLPAGQLQAVRARFRYLGSAAPCGAAAFTDHDDLVFAVQ